MIFDNLRILGIVKSHIFYNIQRSLLFLRSSIDNLIVVLLFEHFLPTFNHIFQIIFRKRSILNLESILSRLQLIMITNIFSFNCTTNCISFSLVRPVVIHVGHLRNLFCTSLARQIVVTRIQASPIRIHCCHLHVKI